MLKREIGFVQKTGRGGRIPLRRGEVAGTWIQVSGSGGTMKSGKAAMRGTRSEAKSRVTHWIQPTARERRGRVKSEDREV